MLLHVPSAIAVLQYAWFVDVWWLNSFSDQSGVMQHEIADQQTLQDFAMNMMDVTFYAAVEVGLAELLADGGPKMILCYVGVLFDDHCL